MKVLALRAAGKEAVYILAEDDGSEQIKILDQGALKSKKKAPRELEVGSIFRSVEECIVKHSVDVVLVKASSVSKSMGLAHLQSAEVRGACVSAAIAKKVDVKLITTEATFAKSGKVKDTIKNDDLFDRNMGADLLKGKRDVALLVINHLDRK